MALLGKSALLAIFLLIGKNNAECENENTMDNIWQEGATGQFINSIHNQLLKTSKKTYAKIKLELGTMHVKFTETVTSWHVRVSFTSPITDFQVWVGGNIQCSSTSCEFDNMDWDGNINAGETLDIPYLYYFPTNAQSAINGIALNGVEICGNSGPTTSPRTTEPGEKTTAHPTKPHTTPHGPTKSTSEGTEGTTGKNCVSLHSVDIS